MQTPLRRYLLAGSVFVLAACSSVSVKTDYDQSVAFAQYRSYTLAPSTEAVGLSPSSEAALSATLRNQLAARGVEEVGENGDLHIVRHISTKEKLSINQSSAGGPYRYGAWAGGPQYTDVSQYTEGTLILDFVDSKTRKLVFRGIASGTVGDPEANAAKIKEAVEKIVANYPHPHTGQ
ncbi:DUF4136 domain-containing protein [Methylomonas sp. SURF-2]|uniref:DUF4136 domain-containing protein n=1 Tax=Methylomonas subterranea TaxID=2952225 RepID=A0ABT1TCS9_9GAMM|nr:DUF4136 domain-containing protein [Methylomonas sp. SURF-2]MCQ8102589.1 DUF4136 domain-containing protein [Methylomonas sp. SURF-2]